LIVRHNGGTAGNLIRKLIGNNKAQRNLPDHIGFGWSQTVKKLMQIKIIAKN
jgi:hypothetical protein